MLSISEDYIELLPEAINTTLLVEQGYKKQHNLFWKCFLICKATIKQVRMFGIDAYQNTTKKNNAASLTQNQIAHLCRQGDESNRL